MLQMYKVFINDKPLFFTNVKIESKGLVVHFKSKDSILKIIESLETEPSCTEAYLYHENIEQIIKTFYSLYQYIEAAGGLIKNNKGQILFIYRLEKWDLPKGKIQTGEMPTEAALREVEEECGISKLRIIKELSSTYHTYPYKGYKVLKRTYWYEMFCEDDENIKAQEEEHITAIQWVDLNEVEKVLDNTYASIKEVVFNYNNKEKNS